MYLTAPQPFELDLRWLQAQAFRWCGRDGWYYGFVKGHLIKVRNCDGGIEFRSNPAEESLAADVRSYFRLDQDIAAVHDALREDGPARAGRAIRWACGSCGRIRGSASIAYICSQNNKIERITTIVNTLASATASP